MITVIALLNGTILILISILHLYWMAGGRWGFTQGVPSKENGELVLRPGSITCMIVGGGLLGFAWYYFSIGLHFAIGLPFRAERWGIWVLAGIFTLRAIGDFHYIGFFKKVKNTPFGRMDTYWYTPLCLWLGGTSFWLALR